MSTPVFAIAVLILLIALCSSARLRLNEDVLLNRASGPQQQQQQPLDTTGIEDEDQDISNPDAHPFDGYALKCWVRGVHAYININDGGCFIHVDKHGIINDKETYAKKQCPFAEEGANNIKRRKWLHLYEKKALELKQAPFAVNDLAMACMKEPLEELHRFALDLAITLEDKAEAEFMCDTFLSLPLMFEGIGFDVPGLTWEVDGQTTATSFMGFRSPYPSQRVWKNPQLCKRIGFSRHARLALRAMLPTYYRHTYAESTWGMLKKGARQILFKQFKDKWKSKNMFGAQLRQVLEAGSSNNMEHLLKASHLRQDALLSQNILERDKGKCKAAESCAYGDDKLDDCALCGQGKCLGPHGKCIPCDRTNHCTAAQMKKECTCHKSICWFFTFDFSNVIKDPLLQKVSVKEKGFKKWRLVMDKDFAPALGNVTGRM